MDMAIAPAAMSTRRMTTRRGTRSAREQLIAHAARLFRDRGYTATSVRDIAKRAGIEPSALYYHFSSKDALLQEVLDRSMTVLTNDVRSAVDALPADASPRDRIREGIAAHVRSHLAHGDFGLASRHVLGQIPAAIRRQHQALRSTYGSYWQSLLAESMPAGTDGTDTRSALARMMLIGALNWTSEWLDPRKTSPDALADVFCGILFDGLESLASPGARSTTP